MIAILKNLLFAHNSIQPQQNHGRRHYPRNRLRRVHGGNLYRASQPQSFDPRRQAARWPAHHNLRGRKLPRLSRGNRRIRPDGPIAKQAVKFGARVENAYVDKVDFSEPVKVLYAGDRKLEAKTVIIATGAAPRLLNIPGESEMFGGKGVTTCATCDGAFYRDMEVVVVGGGDSACEEALFLTRFCSKVTLIHRRNELRASKIMADRTLAHEKITPLWDSAVQEVLPDEEGKAKGIRVKNLKTGDESEVPCKGVFIAIGHVPNTSAFEGIIPLDENGYFLSEPGSMVKTSVPGVFVAGDCADHVYRQAITAAGMGCQSAIEAERWLAELK